MVVSDLQLPMIQIKIHTYDIPEKDGELHNLFVSLTLTKTSSANWTFSLRIEESMSEVKAPIFSKILSRFE